MLDVFYLTAACLYLIGILVLWRGLIKLQSIKPVNRLQPSITIVVPARNEEEHIGPCLDSLTLQNYPAGKYEIIVVDDQSKDRTLDIIHSFMQDYDNISVIKLGQTDLLSPKKAAITAAVKRSKRI
ncbi:MAG: glycosyltransferase [candidate division KSB1 bacterium]|nr:glycosyltransferase [candidate division KSB1 bacterium]